MAMFECAQEAFEAVRLYKLFHDFGRLDLLDTSYTVDEDFKWTMIFEAFEHISDKVWTDYSEYTCDHKLYLSDPAMMEYYRLCRVYCDRFGVSLKKNPYIQKAFEYVRGTMGIVDGSFGCWLQTKVNHKWSSGIVILFDEYFYGHFSLIEALLYIFDFYREETQNLKAELHMDGNIAENQAKEAA